MKKDLIESCVDYLENFHRVSGPETPNFDDWRVTPFPFSIDNVHPLTKSICDRKIGFVDGGNFEIFKSASFCIHLIRVFFSIFKGKKRLKPKKVPGIVEFYVVTITTVNALGELIYKSKIFPFKDDFLDFIPDDSKLMIKQNDKTIRIGKFRPNIEIMGAVGRQFAEWKMTEKSIELELDSGDIFVRDGSLQTGYKGEFHFSNKAYEQALKKNVYLTALAKTSRLLTNLGRSVSSVIWRFGQKKCSDQAWYYYPIADIRNPDHKAEMYHVKFHASASRSFRFEIYKKQAKEMSISEKELIFKNIMANSNDIGFIGYPFGLIDVDKFSHVSKKEKPYHNTLFISEISKRENFQDFIDEVRGIDAHDIINKLRW